MDRLWCIYYAAYELRIRGEGSVDVLNEILRDSIISFRRSQTVTTPKIWSMMTCVCPTT